MNLIKVKEMNLNKMKETNLKKVKEMNLNKLKETNLKKVKEMNLNNMKEMHLIKVKEMKMKKYLQKKNNLMVKEASQLISMMIHNSGTTPHQS